MEQHLKRKAPERKNIREKPLKKEKELKEEGVLSKRAKEEVKAGNEGPNLYNSWGTLLSNLRIREIFPRKELVFLSSTDTVEQALKALSERKILSAPVMETKSGENKFLGFVDVLDIAGYVFSLYDPNPARMRQPSVARHEIFEKPVTHIINFSRVDDKVVVEEENNLLELLTFFCDPAHRHHGRVHRVAVAHRPTSLETGEKEMKADLVNVVSQSDFIRFAAKHADIFGHVADRSLSDLNLWHTSVLVRLDAALVDGLDILYRNRLSGIALVDNAGHVNGNLSASDLRGITPESVKYFEGSILQFLVKGTQVKN
jgi:CBS domain-containing protein